MEEIKIGEYIRTKIGTIGKIKRIDFDEIDKSLKWYIYDKKDYITGIVGERAINKPNIKSHSFNIIDLIQKGDIVNGFKVFGIYNKEVDGVKVVSNTPDEDFYNESVSNEEIYSVLTKEQFKAMEYEVK